MAPKRKREVATQDCSANHQLEAAAVFPHCQSIPYSMQQVAYRKATEVLEKHGGAILATKPGTGKTFISLALTLRETIFNKSSPRRNFAILVKGPLMEHWKAEVQKHVNRSMRKNFVFCTKTAEFVEAMREEEEEDDKEKSHKDDKEKASKDKAVFKREAKIYIVTPHVACYQEFLNKKWNFVGIDEAHTFGNATAYFKCIFTHLQCNKRLLITATPSKDWTTMSQMLHFEPRIFESVQQNAKQEKRDERNKANREEEDSEDEDIEHDDLGLELARMSLLAQVTCTGSSLQQIEPTFRTIVCEPLVEVEFARRAFESFQYTRKTANVIWFNLLNLECLPVGKTLAKAYKILQQECGTEPPTNTSFFDQTEGCSICMMEFTDPRMLSCGHVFCAKCWSNWWEIGYKNGGATCPMCKKFISGPREGSRTWTPAPLSLSCSSSSSSLKRKLETSSSSSSSSPQKKKHVGKEKQLASFLSMFHQMLQYEGKQSKGGQPEERKENHPREEEKRKGTKKTETKKMRISDTPEILTPSIRKQRCADLYESIMNIPKMKDLRLLLSEWIPTHPQEQMIIFTKEYAHSKCIQMSLADFPRGDFQMMCKSCGFEDDARKIQTKSNRRMDLFRKRKIKILCLDISNFASGHDFPDVENVVILDFDTTTHLYQARLRAGCARIHSKRKTNVTVFVNRNSIQEFSLKYLLPKQMEVSLPSHQLLLQLEYFMFRFTPNTRMYRFEQYLQESGASLQEDLQGFQGRRVPSVKIVLPDRSTEVVSLRKFQ